MEGYSEKVGEITKNNYNSMVQTGIKNISGDTFDLFVDEITKKLPESIIKNINTRPILRCKMLIEIIMKYPDLCIVIASMLGISINALASLVGGYVGGEFHTKKHETEKTKILNILK